MTTCSTTANRRTPAREPPSRHRVLVVDDEELVAQAMVEYLKDVGFAVHAVSNGHDALGHYRTHGADVVVTDLRMPGMSGNELARTLRRHDPDLPVVVITGQVALTDERIVIEQTATAVVKKPFRLWRLAQILQKLTQNVPPCGRTFARRDDAGGRCETQQP